METAEGDDTPDMVQRRIRSIRFLVDRAKHSNAPSFNYASLGEQHVSWLCDTVETLLGEREKSKSAS
jgi:hypothetical protein